jgi:hypothetical protein
MCSPSPGRKNAQNPCTATNVKYNLPFKQMLVTKDGVLVCVSALSVLNHFFMDSEVGVAVSIGVGVTLWGCIDVGPNSRWLELRLAASLSVRHYYSINYYLLT